MPRANGRQEAASHGSVIYGFGIDVSPLADLGVVMSQQNNRISEQETKGVER